MFNLKKKILDKKIKKILEKYPYVLFIQFNNVTPKKWSFIQSSLYNLGYYEKLKIKNKVACKLLASTHKPVSKKTALISTKHDRKSEKKSFLINDIFQGPTLMIGCPIIEQLSDIYDILEKNDNLLFIGGLFYNKVITHLDFKEIVKLDKSVFVDLIQQCHNPVNFLLDVKNSVDFECFTSVQETLLQVLTTHKTILKFAYPDK